MGRLPKQGIDCWPMDNGFLRDGKIRRIKMSCGPSSPTILISLLSHIYSDYGYYIAWNDNLSFLIADEVGVTEDAVVAVVDKALQVGFFDHDFFDKYNILTSEEIQKRFFKAIRNRKQVEIVTEYFLAGAENAINESIKVIHVDVAQ